MKFQHFGNQKEKTYYERNPGALRLLSLSFPLGLLYLILCWKAIEERLINMRTGVALGREVGRKEVPFDQVLYFPSMHFSPERQTTYSRSHESPQDSVLVPQPRAGYLVPQRFMGLTAERSCRSLSRATRGMFFCRSLSFGFCINGLSFTTATLRE